MAIDSFIRRAEYKDATQLINAHRRSIREICSRDYTPEQIEAWAGRNFQEDRWQKAMDRDLIWVIADDKDNIYGFGHLQIQNESQAEIAGLYLTPEVTKKGLGKKLAQLILEECRKRNIDHVSLSATRTAQSFYQSIGFRAVSEISFVTMSGVKIECIPMEIHFRP